MNDSKISVRYAKALLDLAKERKITDKVYHDLLIMQELVMMAEIREIMQSPIISSEKKNKILKSVLPNEINETVISFINMVFENKREIYFESIIRNFISSYKILNNIKTVEVTTAVEIDDSQKEKFREQVLETYKANIELKTTIDSSIIGGFIVQVDDLLYDASVKRQLRNIKNTLIQEKI